MSAILRFPPGDAERIGQLLIVGIDGTELTSDLARMLGRIQPGGIILFVRNLLDADQVSAFCRDLSRAVPTPPFLAIDQEGGRVNRLKGILPAIPPNLELARGPAGEERVRYYGEQIGRALRMLGFNLNFAPVLDLSEASDPNGIGDRAFGSRPSAVARLGREFLAALGAAGVLGCGKHFPGLGGGRVDSHLELPVIEKSLPDLWEQDLFPYRELRNDCPMVMVGHAYYPALQGGASGPATLSRSVVTDLLRDRIGFRGLILTDDLEMGAVDQRLSPGEVARRALDAGNDLIMYCKSWDRIEEVHSDLTSALRRGSLSPARVEASLGRLWRAKAAIPNSAELPPFESDRFAEVCARVGELQGSSGTGIRG